MIAEELLTMGVDVLTIGQSHLGQARSHRLPGPAAASAASGQLSGQHPGPRVHVGRGRNGVEAAVLNLQGRTHMVPIDDPFRKADELLELARSRGEGDPGGLPCRGHQREDGDWASTWTDASRRCWGRTRTCRRRTRAFCPTGRPTRRMSGMTGPYDSIIGVEKDLMLRRFLTGIPVRMEPARGKVELHSVIVDVDETTGKAIRNQAPHGGTRRVAIRCRPRWCQSSWRCSPRCYSPACWYICGQRSTRSGLLFWVTLWLLRGGTSLLAMRFVTGHGKPGAAAVRSPPDRALYRAGPDCRPLAKTRTSSSVLTGRGTAAAAQGGRRASGIWTRSRDCTTARPWHAGSSRKAPFRGWLWCAIWTTSSSSTIATATWWAMRSCMASAS